MQTISLAFDPRSRVLSADSDGAGTVIDDSAVTFRITPIEGATIDLQYGVVVCDGARRYHPVGRFGPDGTLALRQQVLAWCTGGTLPISLRITYDDGTVVGSRQLILDVATIPDAYTDMGSGYGELLMLRGTSWDWLPEVLYSRDSFAVHDGKLWQSLKDDNRGNEPSEDSEWWIPVGVDGEDGVSPTVEWEGDVLVVTDVDGEHRSPPLTGPQGIQGETGPMGPQGLPAESTVPGELVVRYVGDGVSTDFEVVHNLHTMSPFVQVYDITGSMPELITVAGPWVKDDCHILLRFPRPPARNTIRVIVSSGLGTGTEIQPYVHEQTQESDVWTVTHKLGRPALFSVLDEDGRMVLCAERVVDDNNTVISFGKPRTGRAVEV